MADSLVFARRASLRTPSEERRGSIPSTRVLPSENDRGNVPGQLFPFVIVQTLKRTMKPAIALTLLFLVANLSAAEEQKKAVPDVLNFKMESLTGKTVSLKDYQGKVILIVNVASRCGATPQYEGLQSLYEDYQDKGFVVLGFPCNQFGSQEPGSADQIQTFCKKNYGVTFPLFAKIEVNGKKAAPLYKYLTSPKMNRKYAGKVRWNFEKFLINREGKVIGRYRTPVEPVEIRKEIEQALKTP